jgi:hypothetical protein
MGKEKANGLLNSLSNSNNTLDLCSGIAVNKTVERLEEV